MLKLLLVAPIPPPYGGIGNWTLLMQDYLNSDSDIDFLGTISISPPVAVMKGRTLYNRIINQGFLMLKINKELKKIIIEKKPSVIHFTTSGQLAILRDLLLLKTAKKFNIPTVYHIRFGRIADISKRNTFEWKVMKKAIKLATKTISIDEKTYINLLTYFNKNKICYIPNFFDFNSILKIEKEEIGDNKKFKLLFLGWCIKTKGIEELLEAWQKVYHKYPDWELDIVGPYTNNYKQ